LFDTCEKGKNIQEKYRKWLAPAETNDLPCFRKDVVQIALQSCDLTKSSQVGGDADRAAAKHKREGVAIALQWSVASVLQTGLIGDYWPFFWFSVVYLNVGGFLQHSKENDETHKTL
jgi:hypothetical protein